MSKDINLFGKTVAAIEKEFGKGSIFLLGDDSHKQNVKVYSSGSIILNHLLGINGFPRGRLLEIFGPEAGGKTTLALHAIAEVQKSKGKVMYIDAEHALDPKYAEKIGVDIANLFVSQPDSGEQAFEIIRFMLENEDLNLIVVDSVAALVPQAELNGDMETYVVGSQARMMSANLRKINTLLAKTETTIIFINQVREKIGVIYGNPEVTPGGRALKFYASIRIDVRQGGKIKQGNEIIGQDVKLKVVKNKLAAPFKIGVTQIIYGDGICPANELILVALELGIIKKKGIWYYFDTITLGQGKEKVRKMLLKDKKIYNSIKEKINEVIKIADEKK